MCHVFRTNRKEEIVTEIMAQMKTWNGYKNDYVGFPLKQFYAVQLVTHYIPSSEYLGIGIEETIAAWVYRTKQNARPRGLVLVRDRFRHLVSFFLHSGTGLPEFQMVRHPISAHCPLSPSTFHCSLLTVHCRLPIAHCPLSAVYVNCPLPVPVFTVRCPLAMPTVRCPLSTTHCPLSTMHVHCAWCTYLRGTLILITFNTATACQQQFRFALSRHRFRERSW